MADSTFFWSGDLVIYIHSKFFIKRNQGAKNKEQAPVVLPARLVVVGVTLKTQARGGHGLNRSEITGFFA